jgi:hypothetical protein
VLLVFCTRFEGFSLHDDSPSLPKATDYISRFKKLLIGRRQS